MSAEEVDGASGGGDAGERGDEGKKEAEGVQKEAPFRQSTTIFMLPFRSGRAAL